MESINTTKKSTTKITTVTKNRSLFTTLPPEILIQILSYIPGSQLFQLTRLSKAFHLDLLYPSSPIWRHVVKHETRNITYDLVETHDRMDWKEEYRWRQSRWKRIELSGNSGGKKMCKKSDLVWNVAVDTIGNLYSITSHGEVQCWREEEESGYQRTRCIKWNSNDTTTSNNNRSRTIHSATLKLIGGKRNCLLATWKGELQFLDIETGHPVFQHHLQNLQRHSICATLPLDDAGHVMLIGGTDKQAHVIDSRLSTPIVASFQLDGTVLCFSTARAHDTTTFAVGGRFNHIPVYDLRMNSLQRAIFTGASTYAFSSVPVYAPSLGTDKYVVFSSNQFKPTSKIIPWNLESGESIGTGYTIQGVATSIIVDPITTPRIITTGLDGRISVFPLQKNLQPYRILHDSEQPTIWTSGTPVPNGGFVASHFNGLALFKPWKALAMDVDTGTRKLEHDISLLSDSDSDSDTELGGNGEDIRQLPSLSGAFQRFGIW